MSKYSTYATMSKWLKWSSLFILLIPLAIFIISCINKWAIQFAQYDITIAALEITLLILSGIWIVLNVVLFFAAGTVSNKASPTGIRIGLLFSFVLVLSPLIVGILIHFNVIQSDWEFMWVIDLILPIIVVIGYIAGYCCAKSAQRKTE